MPTTAGPFDVGDVVPLSVEVTDSSGNLANATSVTVTITLPDGTTSTPSVTNASTGVYTATYQPATAGRFLESWVATGTNASAYSDAFEVRDSADVPIVSLAEIRSKLGKSVTADDELLRGLAATATEVCERWTGRTWRRTTYTETYDGGAPHIALRHTPVLSVTSVSDMDVSITAGTGYTLDSATGILYRGSRLGRWSWLPGRQNVSVTYVAGAANVPEGIRQGVIEYIRYLWDRQRGGSTMPRQVGADEGYGFDPADNQVRIAKQCWGPYRVVPW